MASFGELTKPDDEELTPEQRNKVETLRKWVETEAEFYGRTDDAYLLMFLRSCEFDLEETKKTFKIYYDVRRKVPQWWANRDLNDPKIKPLISLKTITALADTDPNQPLIVITKLCRYGPNLGNFDSYFKLASIIVEAEMRRRNCQMNGAVWIVDFKDYQLWMALKMLSPFVAKNFTESFYLGLPIRLKNIIMINAPTLAFAFHKVVQPFLSQSLRERFVFYGSDWSKISDQIPIELLPEEYGGQAGPLSKHDDAFLKELLVLNDEILDDNKYGYQNKNKRST